MNDLRQRYFQLFKLLALFLVLSILAAYSSSKPDALEKVLQVFSLNKTTNAEDFERGEDYLIFSGLSEAQNHFLSALLGVLIITALVYLMYKISLRLSKKDRTDHAT